MIINWERGKQLFGNSEELLKSEIYNFINVVVPRNTQNSMNYVMEGRNDELKLELKELKGSSKLLKKPNMRGKIIEGT